MTKKFGNNREVYLSPSILSADFSRLGEQCIEATKKGADFLHIDVMDGHFVPNISFGPAVMKSLNKCDVAPYDVHLMIEDPDKYVEEFVTDNTAYITIHQEATRHLDRSISLIKSLGVKAGVSINPATSIENIRLILPKVDLVLIMSVNPGFGGQSFIDYTLDKVRELVKIRQKENLDFLIEVDGGVNSTNSKLLVESGVDILVAGSAVFNKKASVKENINSLLMF